MDKDLLSDINFEIEQIDELFASYQNLFIRIKQSEPDLIEVTALASVLHSFYNGLENIFRWIAKRIDNNVPSDKEWHRSLLNQMANSIPERPAVLTSATFHLLKNYLAFRHFYRHSYSFILEWEEIEKLITPLENTWQTTKAELNDFLHTLNP